MRKDILVIFGAMDHEAQRAVELCKAHGIPYAYATFEGKRVHAGNAYRADDFEVIKPWPFVGEDAYFECFITGSKRLSRTKFDHHSPGDPGYDKGPKEFFAGSSLGQFMNFFGIDPTEKDLYIAASDHCPAAAYTGLCPGIDVERFIGFRIIQKVAFYKTVPNLAYKADQVLLEKIIQDSMMKALDCSIIDGILDLRDSGFIDELPEVGLMLGRAYMSTIDEMDSDRKPTGNRKIVLGGHTTPEQVKAFMKWASALPNKVGEPYGNPARGYAGVVVSS